MTTTTNMQYCSFGPSSVSVCFWNILDYIKYTYSTLLLLFSIVLVMGCIFTRQTKGSNEPFNIPPVISCILFWVLIAWLAIMGK